MVTLIRPWRVPTTKRAISTSVIAPGSGTTVAYLDDGRAVRRAQALRCAAPSGLHAVVAEGRSRILGLGSHNANGDAAETK